MKYIFIWFIFCSTFAHGQAAFHVDTPSILFEAKLIAFVKCGLQYAKTNDRFMESINYTNAFFLKSEGFSKFDLMFIKVELRDRGNMEMYLFLETFPDSEQLKFLAEPDENKYHQFMVDRLYERYKITASSPNRMLDSLCPRQNTFRNKDVYLCFDVWKYQYYALNCDCIGSFDEFKQAIVNQLYIDKDYLDRKTRKYIKAHKVLPKSIIDKLIIEGYGSFKWGNVQR